MCHVVTCTDLGKYIGWILTVCVTTTTPVIVHEYFHSSVAYRISHGVVAASFTQCRALLNVVMYIPVVCFLMCGCCLHEYLHCTCAWWSWRPEEGIDSLKLEMQLIVNCHGGTGNWIRVLWRDCVSPPMYMYLRICLVHSQFGNHLIFLLSFLWI